MAAAAVEDDLEPPVGIVVEGKLDGRVLRVAGTQGTDHKAVGRVLREAGVAQRDVDGGLIDVRQVTVTVSLYVPPRCRPRPNAEIQAVLRTFKIEQRPILDLDWLPTILKAPPKLLASV